MKYDKLNKAVVCSIPDDMFQEEICACVVPSPGCDVTVEDLRAHCEQFQPRGMRIPLIPKHFTVVDQLPQLPNGKVNKMEIRAMFMKLKED